VLSGCHGDDMRRQSERRSSRRQSLAAEHLEPRLALSTVPLVEPGVNVLVAGADIGRQSTPLVSVVDPASGTVLSQFTAYDDARVFRGGVRVAVGDVTGDGLLEVVTAPGPGRTGEIRVFQLDGTELTAYRTLPFGPGYTGGIELAVGDIDGDGRDDIVAAASRGRGTVSVFTSFDPASPPGRVRGPADAAFSFTPPTARRYGGGASVTLADVGTFVDGQVTDAATTDGRMEIVVGSGAGMRATVWVFDASAGPRLVRTLLPFAANLKGGVMVSAASLTDDRIDDILVAAGRGGSSAVELYDGRIDAPATPTGATTAFAALGSPQAPVFIAAVDTTGDGQADRLLTSQRDPRTGGLRTLEGAAFSSLAGPLRIAASRVVPQFVTTPSGLQYRDLVVGSGPVPETGQLVTAHYTGRLLDGTVFDTSLQEGRGPFEFVLGFGQVIAGWDEGFSTMQVGGRRILVIPPELAYGDFPPPGSLIPPGATLVFDVELLAID
jgi:hypothetical protein